MNLFHLLSLVAFIIAAVLAFLVDSVTTPDLVGIIAIGLALFVASAYSGVPGIRR